jgi:hypothetical protein
MRKIITYNTLGENMVEVNSSATVWGELQTDLTRAGVRFEGLRAMTNPGQVTLESLQAELPEGEFQLFLMSQKVKSGVWDEDEDDEDEDDTEYETDDSGMIDSEEGLGWTDEDWTTEDPEQYSFKTPRDLAIARSKRAFHLLGRAISVLIDGSESNKSVEKVKPSDPILNRLKAQAEELKRNMDMFN